MQKVRSKSAQFTFLTFAVYPEKEPDQLNRTEPNPAPPNLTERNHAGLNWESPSSLSSAAVSAVFALLSQHTHTKKHKDTQAHTHTNTHTLHKDTHRHRANNNRNSSTQRCPQLILYACPLSSSHSPSLSLSYSLCLALCDMTSVELTYTWGFCETMFLNQIKIRNEHFTRHCICFAVNFTFPECSPSPPPSHDSPRIREP